MEYIKYPRVYVDQPLHSETSIELTKSQAHYFKTVLRRQDGDSVRAFNGQDGEWLASLAELTKKSGLLHCEQHIKPQPDKQPALHLVFAPIKKQRMDFLIEKAVELGVSDLHPVKTAYTEVGKIKTERLETQITEAAEQCERLSLPRLHPMVTLHDKVLNWPHDMPIYWCYERSGQAPFEGFPTDEGAFLIGPVGGFSPEEAEFLLGLSKTREISLGDQVFRVETAALICLARMLG